MFHDVEGNVSVDQVCAPADPAFEHRLVESESEVGDAVRFVGRVELLYLCHLVVVPRFRSRLWSAQLVDLSVLFVQALAAVRLVVDE